MFIKLLVSILVISNINYAQDSFNMTFRTTSYGGDYAPENAGMVWVMQGPIHIKTIKKFAQKYIHWCTTFQYMAGGDLDGTTGASRWNHNESITASWDLTGQDNQPVDPGKYIVFVEMTESNKTGVTAVLEINVGNGSQSFSDWSGGNLDGNFILQSAAYTQQGSSIDQSEKLNLQQPRLSVSPNPFTNNTTINMLLPEKSASGMLAVYNLQGRRMTARNINPGQSSFHWNSAGLATGVYLVELKTGAVTLKKKVIKQ